jgi:hypothetical protein
MQQGPWRQAQYGEPRVTKGFGLSRLPFLCDELVEARPGKLFALRADRDHPAGARGKVLLLTCNEPTKAAESTFGRPMIEAVEIVVPPSERGRREL